jgi:hypothetical protein
LQVVVLTFDLAATQHRVRRVETIAFGPISIEELFDPVEH